MPSKKTSPHADPKQTQTADKGKRSKSVTTEECAVLAPGSNPAANLDPNHQCKYRSFFLNAVEGIFQSTTDGKYLEVNPSLAAMYGYESPEQLMAAIGDISHQIYVDPSIRDEFKQRIERDGHVAGLEYQVRRKDGSIIWICEHARTVKDTLNNVLCYEGTIQDVTRRREAELARSKLEVQLREAQKMEAIGTLAGGIAHDFNNILGAILGFTEMSIDQVGEKTEVQDYLREVLTAAHRARDLVRQILACSRQMEGERISLRLGQIVKEVLKLMHASLPNSIRCHCKVDTDNDWVLADPTQMHQVLVNLCTNAGYAMREQGGNLSLQISPAVMSDGEESTLLGLRPGNYIRLDVQDTGPGIRPEILGRVFEPFFTTKPAGQGTGLGLSVVHGIIRNHQGAITVESLLGKGATFHIYLPRTEKPTDVKTAEESGPVKGRARILLVDDEESLIKILQPRLRRLGHKVTTRLDSTEAWRTFKAAPHDYDIVVTDMNMPCLSGLDLLQRIKQIRADIPVVLCTGQGATKEFEKLLNLGFASVIAKPVNIALLSRVLRDCSKPAANQPTLKK